MLRKTIRKLSATAPVSWLLARTLHRVDKPVFRLTGGRHTLSSLVAGIPVVMLVTTGARSGATRRVPVLGLRDGGRIAVVASGYGQNDKPPAWYFNLRSHPEATAIVDGVSYSVLAYKAKGEEWDRLWRLALETYPGFADYQRRLAKDSIPVMVLSPRAQT